MGFQESSLIRNKAYFWWPKRVMRITWLLIAIYMILQCIAVEGWTDCGRDPRKTANRDRQCYQNCKHHVYGPYCTKYYGCMQRCDCICRTEGPCINEPCHYRDAWWKLLKAGRG